MTFGEKLLKLRKKSGFSQEELAEKLLVSRQAVSRWESGETMPDSPNLLKISEIFEVSADYLLRDEHEKAEDTSLKKEQNTAVKRKSVWLFIALVMLLLSVIYYFMALDHLDVNYMFPGTINLLAGIIFSIKYFKDDKKDEKKIKVPYLVAAIIMWSAAMLNFITAYFGEGTFAVLGICNIFAGAGFFTIYKGNEKE